MIMSQDMVIIKDEIFCLNSNKHFKVRFVILLKTLFSLNLSQLTGCVGASAGDLEHVPRYHKVVPEYPD